MLASGNYLLPITWLSGNGCSGMVFDDAMMYLKHLSETRCQDTMSACNRLAHIYKGAYAAEVVKGGLVKVGDSLCVDWWCVCEGMNLDITTCFSSDKYADTEGTMRHIKELGQKITYKFTSL